jgi:hypothetical protein
MLELPDVGEFTRMALWMVGSIAGLSTPTHASLRRHFQTMAQRLGWPTGQRPSRKSAASCRPRSAMKLLADALTGSSRAAIASVFGPPRCATAADHALLCGSDVWRGRVWYYPILHPAHDAVAIEFDGDQQARRVMFVGLSD